MTCFCATKDPVIAIKEGQSSSVVQRLVWVSQPLHVVSTIIIYVNSSTFNTQL